MHNSNVWNLNKQALYHQMPINFPVSAKILQTIYSIKSRLRRETAVDIFDSLH